MIPGGGFAIVDEDSGKRYGQYATVEEAHAQLPAQQSAHPDARLKIVQTEPATILKFEDTEVQLNHDETFLLSGWLSEVPTEREIVLALATSIEQAHGTFDAYVLTPDEARVVRRVLDGHISELTGALALLRGSLPAAPA